MHEFTFAELLMQISHATEERAEAVTKLDALENELMRYEPLKQEAAELRRHVEKITTQVQFLTNKIVGICEHPHDWRAGRMKSICILCGRKANPYPEEEFEDDEFDY